jgi:hypothetical protein
MAANKQFNIGDLVKWYDYYAEGDIVRDAGIGIVVRILQKPIPRIHGEYKLYLVQRTARPNQEWYTYQSIDLIAKGVDKEPIALSSR